ncbi:MAG: hypothetical protein RLZZ244_2288 [Verrucomicrobiota bacterium]
MSGDRWGGPFREEQGSHAGGGRRIFACRGGFSEGPDAGVIVRLLWDPIRAVDCFHYVCSCTVRYICSTVPEMTPLPDISDSEWSVMEALWAASPLTASELAKTLRPATNWAENTVRTLLTRLVDKGAVATGENSVGTRTYLPAVKRESCVRAEGESFMQRIFGGAAKPLLVHFVQNSHLTADEVRELKKILDQRLES